MSLIHVTVLWPNPHGSGTRGQTLMTSAVPDVGEGFDFHYEDTHAGVRLFQGRVAQRYWTHRKLPGQAEEGNQLAVTLLLEEAYDVDS